MQRSNPDRRCKSFLAMLAMVGAAACAAHTIPAVAAAAPAAASGKCAAENWDAHWDESVRSASGDVSIMELVLSQCGTVLKASKAETSDFDTSIRNGTWKLSGMVRLEVDGATFDASAATIVFSDGRIHSVDARAVAASPQPPRPVHVEFNGAVLDVDTVAAAFTAGRIRTIQALGSPAEFSYQVKKSGQRVHGRAPRIDYDADKTLITFLEAAYAYGNDEGKTQMLSYNFTDGSTRTVNASGTYRPDERVPTPRTPDRSSAR